ncbi:MAG: hypothetical protein SR1Q7_07340 [Quinella sp. 1Q7]|nr:hypothetical protein [Quinella sp. 1Q7]
MRHFLRTLLLTALIVAAAQNFRSGVLRYVVFCRRVHFAGAQTFVKQSAQAD